MPTTKTVKELVINHIESQEVYDAMEQAGLINDDELYLVDGEGTAVSFAPQELTEDQMTQARLNIGAAAVACGTCATAAGTAAKEITVNSGSWALEAGSMIIVTFTATNTASNPTFNVAGTGAKSVWYGSGTITTGSLSYAGYKSRPMIYVYDGTRYVFMGWSYDSNTTYKNATLGHGYVTCATEEATIAKVGDLSGYTLLTGGIVSVKFTNAVPANATLNINSKGAKAIYYGGAAISAGIIRAGDLVTLMYDGTQYHVLTIDRWQSDIDLLRTSTDEALDGKADKATTLAGYGIADAYTKDEIDNMEFITVDDIDEICGTEIQMVSTTSSSSEVTF